MILIINTSVLFVNWQIFVFVEYIQNMLTFVKMTDKNNDDINIHTSACDKNRQQENGGIEQ